MADPSPSDLSALLLREVIVAMVRREGPALSAHQLAVYLTCYLKNDAQTVRGLATALNVPKSVVTRSLDKLGELDLARRVPDPSDRRGVVIERTPPGHVLLEELRGIVSRAAAQ